MWVTSQVGVGSQFHFTLARRDMLELMNEIMHGGINRRQEILILCVIALKELPEAVFTSAAELIGATYKGVELISRSKEGELLTLFRSESNEALTVVARFSRTIKEAMAKNGQTGYDKARYGYAFYPIDGFTSGELMDKARQSSVSLTEMLFKKKLMIIDDERDFVETLTLNLQKVGFKDIIKCYDGAEGLTYLEQDIPDAILVDMQMPQMSGYEFIGRVKGNNRTKDIPIIIMSAYSVEMEQLGDFVKKKAIPLVNKPFTVEDLCVWLNVLL